MHRLEIIEPRISVSFSKEKKTKMKFLMIIIFATAGDLYVFTEPSFDTKKEFMSFMINKDDVIEVKNYYKYMIYIPKEIQAVNCMTEDEFTKIMLLNKQMRDRKV